MKFLSTNWFVFYEEEAYWGMLRDISETYVTVVTLYHWRNSLLSKAEIRVNVYKKIICSVYLIL